MNDLRLVEEHHRDAPPARQRLDAQIDRFDMDATGPRDDSSCAISLRTAAGRDRAGITGHVRGRWLHVMLLRVDAHLRRGGHGAKLLA